MKQFTRGSNESALVLMYHRIAEPGIDPWDLSVSPKHFEQQIRMLKEKYRLVSIPELAEFIRKGKIPGNCVCISFDDGYEDNFQLAWPMLESLELPATFFISTYFIQQQEMFWWDELAEMLLSEPVKKKSVSLNIRQELLTFHFDDENDPLQYAKIAAAWKWPAKPPNNQCEAYLAIWEKLRPLPLPEIKTVLDKLAVTLNYMPVNKNPGKAMSEGQLRELSVSSLCTVGLHTHTHPALSAHSKHVQEKEIRENATRLHTITDIIPTILAFPYGDYDADLLQLADEMGITMAFVTQEGPVTIKSNLFELGRIQVKDWTGDQLKATLDHWFNL